MAAKKKKSAPPPGVRPIVRNRKARFEYHVLDELEAGMVLTGTEVKSLRNGKVQLVDAYVQVQNGEAFLFHANISTYENGTVFNHEPTRPRKLLLHRREIDGLHAQVREKGLTIIPLELYFRNGRVKAKIGLCRGKATHDKRAAIRERDERRDAMRDQ